LPEPVEDKLLNRIAGYTTRIYVAQLTCLQQYESELGRLIALSRRKQWFPNVIGIHMVDTDYASYSYHTLFPSLRQIRIDNPIEATYCDVIALEDWCQTIHRLYILSVHSNDFRGTPPALLLRLHHLEHVKLRLKKCRIDDPPMIHLLSLGSMRSISLIAPEWRLEITSLELGCRNLRKLELASSVLDLVDLLRNVKIPESTLELSLLTGQDVESMDAWDAFWKRCIALVAQRFAGSLKKLEIYSQDTALPVQYTMLQGLKALTHLEELRLLVEKMALRNNDIIDLARTWPRLHVLRCESMDCEPRPYATLEALYKVAVLCPQLRQLALPLDGSKMPIKSWPPKRHPLDELHIGWFQIEDAVALAERLIRLFPDLTLLKSQRFSNTAQLDTTMDVMKLCRRVVRDVQMVDHIGKSSV
jgi:hypothetical protein